MISGLKEQLLQELEYTLLKTDCHSWWTSKMQSEREDTLEERYAIKFSFKLGKMQLKRMECFRLLWAWIEHQFLSGIRDSRKAGSLRGMMRSVGGVSKSEHQSWLAKRFGLLCWGFKGVQEEIPWEEASDISTRTMYQSTTPSLSQTIWPRWVLRKFLTLPIVQTFGFSLSTESVVLRQVRRWMRRGRRSLTRSHKRASMGPSRCCWDGTISALQPEEIILKGTRVSCVYYQWNAHTKKVWKLIKDPPIYIYIYICTHTYIYIYQ